MHYTLGVLLPLERAATREAVEAALDALMAPYWQDMQVEPYTVRCECVGRTAADEVDAQVESEFGWVASLRERFETDPGFARYRTGQMEASIEADKVWEAFIRLDERRARRRELLEAHPKKDAPSTLEDSTPCVICNMTAKDEWTANPDMKWDWWKIDGRWMRELRGDGATGGDSGKETPCPYCDGTGKRFAPACLPPKSIKARRSLAASERSAATEAASVVECGACGGTGTHPASAQAALAGEIVPLGDVAENLKAHPPAALLTADGAWHPPGEDLCCFGDYSGQYEHQIPRSAWKTMVADIVDRHRDQVIVCVNCHVF